MSSTNVQHPNGLESDAFPKRSRGSSIIDDRAACGAVPVPTELVVEIATSGTRAPIHFVEESTAFRGCSRPRSTQQSECPHHSTFYPNATRFPTIDSPVAAKVGPSTASAPCASHKHHRRTSTPIDGVCLTLLGVSTGLKTPGVDHWAVAGALIESSVDLRTRNARGMTPLHMACAAGQVGVVKVLLLAGADPHARDHRSRCPLHMAALSGSEELVNSLLTCGADPNKASDLGTTALHNAALLGRVEASRAMLVAGGDVDAKDHNSFSPLYLAAQNGHTQVVLDLLAAGADPEIKTTKGFTPLHVAARCGRLTTLRALLNAGVPVDCSSSPAGTTPLHLSAGFSRESCVLELLKRGADPSKVNKRGATPLGMVGALITPPDLNSRGDGERDPSAAKTAFEKKMAQGERVKIALLRAHKWQRRRGVVLLCEALRTRASAGFQGVETAEGVGVGVGVGEGYNRDGRKRCRCSIDSIDEADGGGREHVAAGGGWVIAQLCAHPELVLMRSVVKFL